MKGKPTTKAQKEYHDLLCRVVGCAACRVEGRINLMVSVHHIDGRTKPDAHWKVLPLCAGHHQDGTGAPGLIAVHPWKARFEREYGKQMVLMQRCVLFLVNSGYTLPHDALRVAGLQSPKT